MHIEDLLDELGVVSSIKQFSHSVILITGATGLIGSQLIRLLALANQKFQTEINIIGHARDVKKVGEVFKNLPPSKWISFIFGDVSTDKIVCDMPVDYIVHAAAPTASKDFINSPIEVICTILHGMENILEFAERQPIKKVLYLSTMEIYGISLHDRKRIEDDYDTLNHLETRSSYPESKKMAESMCIAWFHEKQVPVCIARLTQTFGFGVSYQDQRVFAEFARCAVEKRDIHLHSNGETRRNYLFIGDALSAILTLLLKGTSGEAYNVANEEIYLSILEMAELVANNFSQNAIHVSIEPDRSSLEMGYAPTLRMNLSTDKLRSLGWRPTLGIVKMYDSMIQYWNTTITK